MISDDGPGMSEEDLQVFGDKKFSRQVAPEISIGLGSVIMKKITLLHEGILSVKNRREGGLVSSFTFKSA
jgi:K+-sensing histidine kinase KdpD